MSTIQLNPQKAVGYLQGRLGFSALGLDSSGKLAHGAKFDWSSSDTEKLRIDETGQATLIGSGLVWVTARTQFGVSSRAPVLIRPRTRQAQTDDEWQADQDDLKPDGTTSATQGGVGMLLNHLVDGLAPIALAQSGGGDSADFLYDELWSEPRNLVGSPRNRAADASMIGAVLPEGSNFEFSIPIEGLPGRGLPLGVSMNYNSRIWSRHSTAITFNAVNSWPYIGFSLSFGRIVTYASGSNTKFVLIDSSGTRHYLGSGPGGTSTTYQTNDGSHITYVGTSNAGGKLYYNNGVTMTVNVTNNRLLVDQVKDANGNYISISYASQSSPGSCNTGAGFAWKQAISSITDTMGRVVSFSYDNCDNLTSISGPGPSGGTTTLAQFDYNIASSVSTSFSGLTVENMPSGHPVVELKHAYFPDTQTGYLFTYSAYGMIYIVSTRKGMSIDQYGVISDGTEKSYVNFNYPTTASSLIDAPSFSQRTEYPAATSGGTAVYSYSSGGTPGTDKTFTITRPDYSTVTLTRSDASGLGFGLLTQTQIKNSGGTSFGYTWVAYTTDGGGSPQVWSAFSVDELGQATNVNFDYDSFGNMTNTREYGYQQSGAWVVRRRKRAVYKTDTSYLNAYLRSLVIESDVYDGQLDTNDANDVLIAKTTYVYDNYSAMGNMENYGANYGGSSPPPGYDTAYNNQTLVVRGNLTGETLYSDVVTPNYITYNKKIDIFGHVVQEQVSCCNLNTYIYTGTMDWSTPEQITKGDPNGIHLTKLMTFDFNTSLTTGEMDPNGLTTSFGYDNAGRPIQTTSPTTSTKNVSYHDAALSVTNSFTYTEAGGQKTVSGSEVKDGWDRVIQSVDLYNGQVNTGYDAMGHIQSQTLPFTAGGTPGPTITYQYDALGRQILVTLPDSNTIQYSFNGNTTTVTDQVGRKRQRQTDGFGRLVTAVEQDSTGALTQTTTYDYDLLDDLTGVNQGGQMRAFKYDALHRITYERIPEQSATISDGAGGLWSSKYTYTSFSATQTRQDARGVVTSYGYDNLNRLTSITYNTSGAPGVAATNNLTYTFDTSGTSTTKGMLLSISITGALPTYQEAFSYDSFNRISSRTWSRDGRSYTVGYQLNTADQATQVTYPSGRVVNASYDGSAGLSSLTDPSGAAYITSILYDVKGNPTGWTLGNGVTEGFGYDPNRSQPTSHTAGTTAPYTNRMNMSYSYQAAAGQMGINTTAGNAGQLISISGSVNGATENAAYTWDNLGRLVTATLTSNGSTAQRRFGYDRWGNRTSVWDATSGGNQLQSIALQQSSGVPTNQIQSVTSGSTAYYTFDAAGNLTNDGVHTYQYDAENRLVSVDGGATGSYAYDDQNRRIRKAAGTTAIHYTWDGSRVLAEHNASTGAQIIDYVYASGKLLAAGAGNILGGNGSVTYVLNDRMSERVSLDAYGNVTGRQAHLPFGEDFGGSGTQEKHHFTTYERDSETGSDYAINRFYSPLVGRFLSADPYTPAGCLNDPRNWNQYSYTRNVVVNRGDKLGLSDGPIAGGCTLKENGWYPGQCLCEIVPEVCQPSHHPPFVDGGGDGGADFADKPHVPLPFPIPPSLWFGLTTSSYRLAKVLTLPEGKVCVMEPICKSSCGSDGEHLILGKDSTFSCPPYWNCADFSVKVGKKRICVEFHICKRAFAPGPCS